MMGRGTPWFEDLWKEVGKHIVKSSSLYQKWLAASLDVSPNLPIICPRHSFLLP